MNYIIESHPDYDYTFQLMKGDDLMGTNIFTTDISFLRCTCGEADISINALLHPFKEGTSFMLLDGMFFKVAACTDTFHMEKYTFSIRFFN